MMSRSQRSTSMVLCTRHSGDECTSRRVWCSHTGLAPAHGTQVSTGDRLPTARGSGTRRKEKNPLLGAVCLLTQGGLRRVRQGIARFRWRFNALKH
jgi:hypothetical protein